MGRRDIERGEGGRLEGLLGEETEVVAKKMVAPTCKMPMPNNFDIYVRTYTNYIVRMQVVRQ